MAKSPEEMAAAMVANMKEKTGKTLEQWQRLAAKSGETKHGKIVAHLKAEHGLTHGYANMVAMSHLQAQAGGSVESADLVEAQYAGAKADLRPIYEALLKQVKKLGRDVEVSPKKAYVSLRRSKQFALVQPSTRTRIDLGLNLRGVSPEGRLEASGSFNSMCTHRIRLAAPTDVDAEVAGWLQRAYAEA